MRRPWRISITLRVALLVSSLAILTNLAVVTFIYWRSGNQTEQLLRSQVGEEAAAFGEVYRRGGRSALQGAISDAAADPLFFAALLGPDGQVLAGSIDTASVRPVLREGFAVGPIDPAGPRAPVVAGFTLHPVGQGLWLLNGRAYDAQQGFERTLESSLLLALAVALAVGALSGLLAARYVGQRVQAMTATARSFAAADFSRRVPHLGTGDPFDSLAGEVNHMLDRIEALMRELRAITDSLAHDLRSPVGRLRARVEAALATTDPQRRDVLLAGVVAEADNLTRILATVLEIGRSEAMTSRDQFEWLDPSALIAELCDMYEPLVEDQGAGLSIESRGPLLPVFGHRQLLAQALSNLIDNALRHGGDGVAIRLFGVEEEHGLRLTVADDGPGIPADDRAEALRRFGRLDAARPAGGAGLGLSLVEAVAHLHGGGLELGDADPGEARPGLLATLVIPRGAGSGPPPGWPASPSMPTPD